MEGLPFKLPEPAGLSNEYTFEKLCVRVSPEQLDELLSRLKFELDALVEKVLKKPEIQYMERTICVMKAHPGYFPDFFNDMYIFRRRLVLAFPETGGSVFIGEKERDFSLNRFQYKYNQVIEESKKKFSEFKHPYIPALDIFAYVFYATDSVS